MLTLNTYDNSYLPEITIVNDASVFAFRSKYAYNLVSTLEPFVRDRSQILFKDMPSARRSKNIQIFVTKWCILTMIHVCQRCL